MGEISFAVLSASIEVRNQMSDTTELDRKKMNANFILRGLEIHGCRVSVTIIAKVEKW